MKIVTRVFSYNFRWLARQLICEALKFGDDGIQSTVVLLEESDLCGPINFTLLVEVQFQFLQESVKFQLQKIGGIPSA